MILILIRIGRYSYNRNHNLECCLNAFCIGVVGTGLEQGVVDLHLPTRPLRTRSGLELVPRYEPSTCQPIVR